MPETASSRLQQFIESERERSREWSEEHRRRLLAMEQWEDYRDQHIMPALRRAISVDYTRWLRGFMDRGGEPTHFYDYPLAQASFYVLQRDVELIPLFGSQAVEIIVPKGRQVTYKNLGHNNLYFMDGFTHAGGWVPVYADTRF